MASESADNQVKTEQDTQAKNDKKVTTKKTKKRIDPNTLVPVNCNINSDLTYRSEISKRRFDWSHYGATQDMELSELQNMPVSYYKNNWVKIDDQDIVDYLRIGHYYKDSIDEDDIETFFEMDTDEMNRFLDHIKPFERAVVVNRAKEKFKDKTFDSAHKIDFLERKYNISIKE